MGASSLQNVFLVFAVIGAVTAAPFVAQQHAAPQVHDAKLEAIVIPGLQEALAYESAAPPAGHSHYGDPYAEDCLANEVNITIVGVTGAMCSPSCAMLDSCPKDVPKGVIAKPTCALQDMAGHKYCALVCALKLPVTQYEQGLADAQCGVHASCKAIGTVGICTYDE
mmetsp:Transcript_29026/g.59494  ORF Transcript_29026/g.59494 Transcript_29026/m.59494 type:complete len:167 (-) Transcript_29026:280-780(-)